MVVCVNCGLEVPSLYHVYDKTSFCLATCVHCGKISDKYVEWELPLMIIDLFLFKVEVYRHLIHNYSSRPFSEDNDVRLRRKNKLIKVILLIFSSTILDSYSMMTTCNYLTEPSDMCYSTFESYNRRSLDKLFSYFSSSFHNTHSPSKFNFQGIESSLGRESPESVTDLIQNMTETMLFHSRLKIFERRGQNDEYCRRTYRRAVELLFLLFLQNPTVTNLEETMSLSCKDVTELGIISLSFFRVISYCLYIAFFNKIVSKLKEKYLKIESGKDCKCNVPELHRMKISYTDIIFSLLLCFHIKALVLMMNIWYPRHSILIVIELYIYLSHVVELNGICNLSIALSSFMVVSGALVKLGVYFMWFEVVNKYNLVFEIRRYIHIVRLMRKQRRFHDGDVESLKYGRKIDLPGLKTIME